MRYSKLERCVRRDLGQGPAQGVRDFSVGAPRGESGAVSPGWCAGGAVGPRMQTPIQHALQPADSPLPCLVSLVRSQGYASPGTVCL
jgi:hypothetical protein